MGMEIGIAKFYRVSLRQFKEGCEKVGASFDDKLIKEIWDGLSLPKRSTKGSAGYDFIAPYTFMIRPGSWVTIPTGIRAKIDPGYALILAPRSGMGTDYNMRLANTIGIVDSDYFGAYNEGHIFATFTAQEPLTVPAGTKFMQGMFLPYGVTVDDMAKGIRTGGFGSTDKHMGKE